MCGGVLYKYQGQEYRTYFPNPKAKLPVLRKNGEVELMPWGRRKDQPGNLPLGGWARLESIHKQWWDKYFPKPVKIPALAFMEKDFEGTSHWFDVTKGQYIQGLIAHYDSETRLYVVTITPTMLDAVHDRFPRLVTKNGGF